MINSIADFLPFVLPEVAGAPPDFVTFHLQAAARRFFDRTESWRVTSGPIDIVADQASYTLDPGITDDTEPEVRRIVWAKRSGILMSPDLYYLDLADSPTTCKLTFYDDYIPSTNVTDDLTVRVVLVPVANTDIIPASLLTKYMEGIRTEALHSLFAIPGNRWSSEYAAERYRRLAAREVSAGMRENNVDGKELTVQAQVREWV